MLIAAVPALPACHSEPLSAPPRTPNAAAPEAPAKPARQLGIDIDFYSGINVGGPARQDAAYINSLQANAASISFPFFSNPAGTTVTAAQSTPASAQLGTVITAAQHDDLAVTLRPLDEKSIGESRVDWEPVKLAAWFAAYQRFLLPYAALAQHDHVAMFIVGVEFTRFSAAPQWDTWIPHCAPSTTGRSPTPATRPPSSTR